MAGVERVETVAGVMSRRVVGLRTDCDLEVAAQAFARTGLRHLVVVEPDRRVLGFVTAERVLLALAGGGASVRVRDLVEDAGVRITPQDTLRTAAGAMLDALVDAVLVTERSGRVVGVLTWSDVVAHVAGRDAGSATLSPRRRTPPSSRPLPPDFGSGPRSAGSVPGE